MTAVSVVIPVHNAGSGLLDTVRSVLAQSSASVCLEIILVDDRSADDAVDRVRLACPSAPLVVLSTDGTGAAAAINRGVEAARHPLVAQVDQDVVLHDGWLARLLEALAEPEVAAAQGQYVTDAGAPLLARVMGRDLETRYAAVSSDTGHVCTGNVVYRASALRQVGGFDESLGYGYDNDMSYRLRAAGYRLRYVASAQSTHRWRDDVAGYLWQQYGFGYGRLDLVAKHRGRVTGDSVSPAMMMAHPVVTAVALAFGVTAVLVPGYSSTLLTIGAMLLLGLAVERTWVGVRTARRTGDPVPLLFPVVHLLRDLAWVGAMVVWVGRRMSGAAAHPRHSMKPRRAGQDEAEPA